MPVATPSARRAVASGDGGGKGAIGEKNFEVFVICSGFGIGKRDGKAALVRATPADGGDKLDARAPASRSTTHSRFLGLREAAAELSGTQWTSSQ